MQVPQEKTPAVHDIAVGFVTVGKSENVALQPLESRYILRQVQVQQGDQA